MKKFTDFILFLIFLIVTAMILALSLAPPEPIEPAPPRSVEQLQLDSLYSHVEEIRDGVQGVTYQLWLLCMNLTDNDAIYCTPEAE